MKGRNHLEDLSIDGIIFQCFLRNQEGRRVGVDCIDIPEDTDWW
jgi:hypothetical protein